MLKRKVAFSVLGLLILSSCDLVVQNPVVNIDPNQNNSGGGTTTTTALSCSATAPGNGIVSSGQATNIALSVSGGVGPYGLSGSQTTFASTTVLSRTYTNTTSTNSVQTETITVLDAKGSAASCQLSVTVLPASTTGTPLACSISTNPTSPHVGDSFPLVVTTTGGTGPYTYQNPSLDAGGSNLTTLTVVSPFQATEQITYSSAGQKTLSIAVKDSTNTQVTCTAPLTVRAQLYLGYGVTPSGSVPAGSPLTITATSQGFATTPTYSVTSTETGITISQNGAVTSITSNSMVAHPSFSVTLKALATNGETLSLVISGLQFTYSQSTQPLTCSIDHGTGTIQMGTTVTFAMNPSALLPGETFVTSWTTLGSGSTLFNATNNSVQGQYSTAGTKYITAIAQTKINGVTSRVCNGNGYVTDSLSVGGALACNAFISPTNYYSYDSNYPNSRFLWRLGSAQVASDSGVGTISLVGVNFSGYYQNRSDGSVWLYLPSAATYSLTLEVADSIGQTAYCSTTTTVSNSDL